VSAAERIRVASERRIGRVLIALTYVSVVMLVIGVGLLLAAGVSPLAGGPALDLATLPASVAAFAPAGFLWLGLVIVIATPVTRVLAAAVAYGRAGDWSMVAVAAGIVAIIAIGILTAAADTV
jgi:uncharacterized membrane protein